MLRKYLRNYFFLFLGIFALCLGVVYGVFSYYSTQLPPLASIKSADFKVGSEVFDKDGNVVYVFAYESRDYLSIKEIPVYVYNSLCSVEDKKFYDHWGVDLFGIFRALVLGVVGMRRISGTSTITQQLAKNMFLSSDRSVGRKVKEAMLAVKLEKNFSKNEILEFYLNKVYLGAGQYGIEAASQRYFEKSARDLNKLEAAFIVGLLKAPEGYSPYRRPFASIERRNLVLRRMLDDGVLSEQEYEDFRYKLLNFATYSKKSKSIDYYIDYVKRELLKKYSIEQIFGGGLKIYTPLDFNLQNYADSIVNVELSKVEERNKYDVKYSDYLVDTADFNTDYLQVGVFSLDPHTGYVRVLLGGRNFGHSKFNRIMQAKRQPGSSFKPIVYSTALRNGYTPATVIQDEPVEYVKSDTVFWEPVNYSRKNYSYLRMREALKKSKNIYTVKMGYDITPKRIVYMARDFGLTGRLTYSQSVCLGSHELQPYELISAYTTFANQGKRVEPIFITRVENSQGKVLFESEVSETKVLSKQEAFLMNNMLQSVIKEGTGRRALWMGYRWTAGGKTGTSSDFRDAWFIGFNKFLVTGVWVGFDDFRTIGEGQAGSNVALPIWVQIMKKAVYDNKDLRDENNTIVSKRLEFEKPTGIISKKISKVTGLLPKSSSESVMMEYFIDGTQPTIAYPYRYNFSPTCYRNNEKNKLIIDFGGEPYDWEGAKKEKFKKVYPDSLNPNFFVLEKVKLPKAPSYGQAAVLRGRVYVEDEHQSVQREQAEQEDLLMDNLLDSLLIKTYQENIAQQDTDTVKTFFNDEDLEFLEDEPIFLKEIDF